MANKAEVILSAQDKSKAAFNSFKRNLTDAQGAAEGLQGRLGSVGVAVTSALAGVSLKQGIDLLDQLDDLSEKSGISAKSLSELRYAGEVAGTPFESLGVGIKKLSKNLADAAGGGKESVALFKTLGVSVTDANGDIRATDQVLLDVAERFAGYQNDAAKAALAQNLFGKSGDELIPILNRGRDGIKALADEGRALGVVYSDDLAKQAGDFNDQLKRLEFAAEGSKHALLETLLPTLNATAEALLRNTKGVGLFKGALLTIGEGLTKRLGLDDAGKLQSEAEGISNEIERVTNQVTGLRNVLDREPDNASAARRYANLTNKLAALQKQAGETSTKLKVLADQTEFGDHPIDITHGTPTTQAPFVAKGDEAAAKAAEKAEKAYQAFIATITLKTSATQAEIATNEKLTEGQQLSLEIVSKLANTELQFTDAQKQAVTAQLESLLALEKTNDARKAQLSAAKENLALRDKEQEQLTREVASLESVNQSMRDSLEEMGLTSQQLTALKVRRLEAAVATDEQALAEARLYGADSARQASLEEKVRLGRENIRLTKEQATATEELTQKLEVAGKVSSELGGFLGSALGDAAHGEFKKIGDDFEAMLERMVTEALAKDVMKYLLGDYGTTGTVGGAAGGSGYGGLIASGFEALFGGGRAGGGSVSRGRMYEVAEHRPELLEAGGRSYLMMGAGDGRVEPRVSAGSGRQGNTYYLQMQLPQGADRRTGAQFGAEAARQLKIAELRNG